MSYETSAKEDKTLDLSHFQKNKRGGGRRGSFAVRTPQGQVATADLP
ncbi:MAG: hypothetical protein ACI3ZW_05430 [Parabacteroides sp.]